MPKSVYLQLFPMVQVFPRYLAAIGLNEMAISKVHKTDTFDSQNSLVLKDVFLKLILNILKSYENYMMIIL